MRILLINQYYCPDSAATGQLMADEAQELSRRGHEVHVLCSARAYGGGDERYPSHEILDGVHIHRVGATGFGRKNTIGRLADYLSFYLIAMIRAFLLPRMDVCVCLTTPPFIGVVGAALRALKGTQFILWVMDVYPQIAVTLGAIKQGSPLDRVLGLLSKSLYRRASQIISLGEVMTQRLVEAGANPARICTIHNWVPREAVEPKPRKESRTRAGWGLNGDLTVMYSGNLGLGHDLTTFVKAAHCLQKDIDFKMLFVGEGRGRASLEKAIKTEDANCVSFYPPRPLADLSDSLAAGDIHLVSQNSGTQGLIVPSKVYGILASGRPSLFVGPEDCEPAQIIRASNSGIVVPPGDVEGATKALRLLLNSPDLRKSMGQRARECYASRFGCARGVAAISEAIEETANAPLAMAMHLKPLLLLAAAGAIGMTLAIWGKGIGRFFASPFQDLWNGGLAQAFHTYSASPTFWGLLVGSFVISAGLTPLVMMMARKIGAVDRGGFRKVSQGSIPLLGGIAVAIPFFIACILGIIGATNMLKLVGASKGQLWATLIGSVFILGVGIVDDIRGMRVRNKFLAQVIAALFLCFCGYSVRSISLPLLGTINLGIVMGTIFTILWIVGLTNALNIIDGLDGLASGIALIAAVALGFIAAFNGLYFVVLLCTVLVGSLTAFLLFNFNPARVFLGDTGSLFLGFALASISLTGSMKTMGTVVFLAPMLALGLPIFEVGFSMLRRFIQGLPISSADAGHIHHRLLKRGFSQRSAVLIMYAAAIFCMLAALFTATLSSEKASVLLIPLGIYSIVMLAMGWLAGYSRSLRGVLVERKRNIYYQTFINYAKVALTTEIGGLGSDSIFGLIRREMRLSYINVSFEDTAQPIGSSGEIPDRDSNYGLPQSAMEIRVKSPDGYRFVIRYQHDGTICMSEMEAMRKHLGRLFEHVSIKHPAQKANVESVGAAARQTNDPRRNIIINTAFTRDTVVVASPDSVSADMGGEQVILNLASGVYFGLDEVGARIWSLIEKPRCLSSIVETLLAEYEVEPRCCESDLHGLLEHMSEAKLIEIQ